MRTYFPVIVVNGRLRHSKILKKNLIAMFNTDLLKNINVFFFKKLITNIICLGDSHIEIDAAHVLAKYFDN